jgi:hypothetical protein
VEIGQRSGLPSNTPGSVVALLKVESVCQIIFQVAAEARYSPLPSVVIAPPMMSAVASTATISPGNTRSRRAAAKGKAPPLRSQLMATRNPETAKKPFTPCSPSV